MESTLKYGRTPSWGSHPSTNYLALKDISSWDLVPPYRWIGWSLPNCFMEMDDEKKLLLKHLVGATPLASRVKYKSSWGRRTREYSSMQGYGLFDTCPTFPTTLRFGKWSGR